jgi:adenylate cyclase
MARQGTGLIRLFAGPRPVESVEEPMGLSRRRRQRLLAAFRDQEHAGLWAAALIRTLIIAAFLAWMLAVPGEGSGSAYGVAVTVLFLVLGGWQVYVYRRANAPRWAPFAFVLADALALGVIAASPNPFHVPPMPAPIALREATFVNLFILLLQVAFSFRPLLVLWAGLCSVAVTIGATAWIAREAGVFAAPGLWHAPGWLAMPADYFDPLHLPLGKIQHEVLVLLGVTVGLAFLVWRTRQLVAARAAAERARGNLARYFSPKMVDELERRDEPAGLGRRQNVAVLFADIVGFTTLVESVPPEQALELLRAFHARMEAVVFAHGGCLERLAGDSLMASFGVPDPGARDAADALACARAMLVALAAWNKARERAELPRIAIGIGLHYGPAVLGDIGTERSMAFTVIGDTVNLASRLQAMTRELDAVLCCSETLVLRARTDGAEPAHLADLEDRGALAVRGREQPVKVFTLAATQ